jgi:hypothetical protein
VASFWRALSQVNSAESFVCATSGRRLLLTVRSPYDPAPKYSYREIPTRCILASAMDEIEKAEEARCCSEWRWRVKRSAVGG